MSKPVQLFLEWEIDLELNLLGKTLQAFTIDVDGYNTAVAGQLPITVDQVRKSAGLPMHPDSSAGQAVSAQFPFGDVSQGCTLARGAMPVATADPGTQSTDATIPNVVLVGTWDSIDAANSSLEVNQLNEAQLQAQYAALYAAAHTAATALNVDLT